MEAVTEHMMFTQQVELCGAAKAGFDLYIVFLSPQLNPQFRAKSLISLQHEIPAENSATLFGESRAMHFSSRAQAGVTYILQLGS